MKSKDIKYVLNIAMRLTVIVAVVVAMLATVNAVTKDRIAENNAASRNAACGELIEGAEFESFDISALNVDYSDITNFDKNSVAVWRADSRHFLRRTNGSRRQMRFEFRNVGHRFKSRFRRLPFEVCGQNVFRSCFRRCRFGCNQNFTRR